jgi:2-phospho-L-lactate/phosphoenolpyruvate guanylyltransferase
MMPSADRAAWALVLPVKDGSIAKSRLAPFAGDLRPQLALAMAADCVAAALRCGLVALVVAVTNDRATAATLGGLGAVVVPDAPAAGLNPALVHGAAFARGRSPGYGVGAMSADLPALRTQELAAALGSAPKDRRSFVADCEGSGTTLLLAPSGVDLAPAFGAGSAKSHEAAGAVRLGGAGLRSLRRDVDTEPHLLEAVQLGVGPRTRAVLASLRASSPR